MEEHLDKFQAKVLRMDEVYDAWVKARNWYAFQKDEDLRVVVVPCCDECLIVKFSSQPHTIYFVTIEKLEIPPVINIFVLYLFIYSNLLKPTVTQNWKLNISYGDRVIDFFLLALGVNG